MSEENKHDKKRYLRVCQKLAGGAEWELTENTIFFSRTKQDNSKELCRKYMHLLLNGRNFGLIKGQSGYLNAY